MICSVRLSCDCSTHSCNNHNHCISCAGVTTVATHPCQAKARNCGASANRNPAYTANRVGGLCGCWLGGHLSRGARFDDPIHSLGEVAYSSIACALGQSHQRTRLGVGICKNRAVHGDIRFRCCEGTLEDQDHAGASLLVEYFCLSEGLFLRHM